MRLMRLPEHDVVGLCLGYVANCCVERGLHYA